MEVYLAYQVKLRERLKLQLLAPDMRFFRASYVIQDERAAAETRVREEEATGSMTIRQPLAILGHRPEPHRARGSLRDAGTASRGDGGGTPLPRAAPAHS
ncbi:NEL-type E3 ubiquitin ligase domain-containing protein [Bradyrhizobium sp. BEA-2-5]|uniref:NEL-type E3 ubiquitin ligase domain-containing protein n=1 Tax=Bradyrhizobium sp. BEA-2-5 TaxID=3080015 RepID=UPI00293F1DFB|nr:NEL-type E3 ubiquitin ligase domain-containing protein [Bradyrhizobium sp. BEA-2-5]WOH85440.1 NEL-type E3 ubiquitin ligase domain-containing protein [Bradyrhizobium sp. BEA-2-5]